MIDTPQFWYGVATTLVFCYVGLPVLQETKDSIRTTDYEESTEELEG